MIKAVIIEDSLPNREDLENIISNIDKKIDVVVEEGTKDDIGFVDNCVKLIDKEKPDVVFLDIELRGGNGFDLLEKVVYKDFYFIIITGTGERGNYPHKASRYKQVRPEYITYIEKPLQDELIADAIKMLKAKIQKDNPIIIIPTKYKNIHVKHSDIILCKEIEPKEKHFMKYKTTEFQCEKDDGSFTSIISTEPLEYFKSKYNRIFATFFEVCDNFYINKSFVESTDDIQYEVTMKGGEKIELTMDKLKELNT
jgi:two-component system LytT family response regulator